MYNGLVPGECERPRENGACILRSGNHLSLPPEGGDLGISGTEMYSTFLALRAEGEGDYRSGPVQKSHWNESPESVITILRRSRGQGCGFEGFSTLS